MESDRLVVEVSRVRWRAPDGAFAVLDGVTEEGEPVVVRGALGHLCEGETADVAGSWREHERFGTQFHARAVRVREPVSEAALLGALGAVRHVGVRAAAWLLDRHGAGVLEAVDADPWARLGEVPGIGPARLRAAVASWQEVRAGRALRLFLDGHGVPAAVAARACAELGPAAADVLAADPYRLAAVPGVGFAIADALARSLGFGEEAPARLRAGVLHLLGVAEGEGHCGLPREELARRGWTLLGRDVEDAVGELASERRVVVEDGVVAPVALHAVERRLASYVRGLLESEPAFSVSPGSPDGLSGFTPTEAQWTAVAAALSCRLSILTGGPGTGKTQAMRALVEVLARAGRRARLCAPTGKAARRLAESTGAEATTIHRLLEWAPGEGPARGADDPIDGCDVLVVDEASMLDVRLAESLLAAVGPGTNVLLVGDPDQLAPVGPGRVLADLLASGRVPVTRLTEIFRQAARSLIVQGAHAINRGEYPPLHTSPDVERDLYVVAREGPRAIVEEIVSLATRRLPDHLGVDARADVQVLAPVHRGPVGIDALNAELRAVLNPDGPLIRGSGGLRVGDRVVQTVNDHERQVMNGEVGVLVDHDPDRDRTILATDDGRRIALPGGALDTLRPAYAMSVHKAQGSSARAVVIPLFRGHGQMLTRNLVYTALTRAERLAVLVGEPEALGAAVQRTDGRRRHTRLEALVRAPP